MTKEEFDTSDLAWITYKIFYDCNFEVEENNRKYIPLQLRNTKVDLSGDTDFNFGPGWSNSVFHKYNGYLGEVPKENEKLYRDQLSICKKLFYSIVNVSLMPQTGNLQCAKKGIGNDRLDTFIWALSSYYDGETSLLFNYATYQNTKDLKDYLQLFFTDNNKSIYKYCLQIYGMSQQLVDEFIESGKLAINSPERVIQYMKLAYRFWRQKLMHINGKMEKAVDVLSLEEKKKMESEIERVTKLLDNWF